MNTVERKKIEVLTPDSLKILKKSKAPKKTESYTPITHTKLINFVADQIDSRGLKIVNQSFETNKKGTQMFGHFGIESDSSDLRMAFGFRNSYDKSIPVGMASGAQVIVCSNLMLIGDVVQHRRHTRNMEDDLLSIFEKTFASVEEKFNKIEEDVLLLKEYELTMDKASEMFGKLLRESIQKPYTSVASTNQVSAAVKYFEKPLHDFGNETKWGFYNAFTEAFKGCHPYESAGRYLKLHDFVMNEA